MGMAGLSLSEAPGLESWCEADAGGKLRRAWNVRNSSVLLGFWFFSVLKCKIRPKAIS